MLEIEYMTDKNGQPKAVVIPIELWRQLLPDEDVSVEELSEKIEMHFIEFIRSRYSAKPATQPTRKPKMRWSDTPLYGLWQDREEMADPADYVRRLRRPRF